MSYVAAATGRDHGAGLPTWSDCDDVIARHNSILVAGSCLELGLVSTRTRVAFEAATVSSPG
eukprot:m.49020 g.49020  ORF g.49020 m.49020 type:complete len:62 (+) comp12042_c1_seq1:85-270(+)